MSYEIEYRHAVFKFDGQPSQARFNALCRKAGLSPHYPDYAELACVVSFVEHGSSNTVAEDGTRARSWSLQHAGPVPDVMERVILASVYAENGMTLPKNRYQTAEAYIAANRKRISAALPLQELFTTLDGSPIELVVHDFNQELADRHVFWQELDRRGCLYVPPYRSPKCALRVRINGIDVLEDLLMCVSDVRSGATATMGSLRLSCMDDALNGLEGGGQLRPAA